MMKQRSGIVTCLLMILKWLFFIRIPNVLLAEMDMLAKKEELSHFSDLKKLNVDLTQYLIQEQAPPVNEEFRVTQGSSSF